MSLDNDITVNDRINTLMKTEHLKNQDVASELGVTEATIRNFRTTSNVKDVYLEALCNRYHYRLEWLKHGMGDMKKPAADSIIYETIPEIDKKFKDISTKELVHYILAHKDKLLLDKTFYLFIENEAHRKNARYLS